MGGDAGVRRRRLGERAMRLTDAYGDLRRMDRPVLTTEEAAARWKASRRTTSHRLKAMEEGGLVRRLRPGMWALDLDIGSFAVAPFLTAPHPAYVSFWSALAHHGLIEQIPRRISVASLSPPRRIETAIGSFDVHQIAPALFGGYKGSERRGYLASAAKALFDTVYVRAAAGGRAYFTELHLSRDFDRGEIGYWIERIESPRLRTLVSRRVREALNSAADG
jgi:predicted transcriptional regulator of viral defense system